MPSKKTVTKRSASVKSSLIRPASRLAGDKKPVLRDKFLTFIKTPKNLIIILLILAAVSFWGIRNYFIVATVNGQPVSRFEFNSRLKNQFGDAVLDQLINERLLLGAVRQEGIFVTANDIDTRVKEIENNLQGQMSLEEALSLQGMSPTSFRRQLELQMSIEKLFGPQATVSSEEIEEYLANNQNLFPEATEPAKLRSEVEGFIKQQKISKLYEEWFEKLKQDSKINRNI